jgi:hypothetical protein
MNREFIILDTSDGAYICPLGLHECPDFEPEGWCVNAQYCLRVTEAWRLYKIFILAHLPPIYLGTGADTDWEWQKPEHGFQYLNNCDFILYYAAKFCTFEEWKLAYFTFSNRCHAYVRAVDYPKFERLRVLLDKDYASRAQKPENDEDDIPF